MTIKRFYGNTIAEAKAEAKAALGDNFILLETKAPVGKTPACIAVMAKAVKEVAPEPEQVPTYSREHIRERVPVAAHTNNFSELFEAESEADFGYEEEEDPVLAKLIAETQQEKEDIQLSRRNISLYKEEKEEKEEIKADYQPPKNQQTSEQAENISNDDRLARLEQLIISSFIQANSNYISLPVYQQLLSMGIPAGMINGWFNETLKQGTDPIANPKQFLNHLGAVIQKHLPHDASLTMKRIQVFIGPAGAGKTSLITKLTKNKHLLAGNNVAIISINGTENTSKNAVLCDYSAQHRFEYFEVNNGKELAEINNKLKNFDHILIDTPSLSLHPVKAKAQIDAIEQVLAYLPDFELHFVVNATLNTCYFDEKYLSKYPLRPDFISLTHLDETLSWGHFLPLIEIVGCNIRYVSEGADPFDEVRTYTKSWFTEQLLTPNEF